MIRQTDHLSDMEIARYSGQTLAPAELLAADRHLAGCDECYARLLATAGADDRLRAANRAFHLDDDEQTEHIPYEQLVALVDHQLDDIDREIAESHLEFCS